MFRLKKDVSNNKQPTTVPSPLCFWVRNPRDSTSTSSKWLDQCPQRPLPWNQPSSSDKTRPNGYDIDFERSWSSQRVGSQRFQGHLWRGWTNFLGGFSLFFLLTWQWHVTVVRFDCFCCSWKYVGFNWWSLKTWRIQKDLMGKSKSQWIHECILGCPPSQDSSNKWRFSSGSPTTLICHCYWEGGQRNPTSIDMSWKGETWGVSHSFLLQTKVDISTKIMYQVIQSDLCIPHLEVTWPFKRVT